MTPSRCIPLWIKLAYTAFMLVLIPVYWTHYGPENFLYFCDAAALATLAAVWLESPLLCSAALVGIFLPQMLWVADFLVELCGGHLTGMTSYMFKPPFYLRFLSFFHFWLPFLLLWLVCRLGYDRRGILLWTVLTWILLSVAYFWMPPPGSYPDDPNRPVNINYVFGLNDDAPQTWMGPNAYYALMMLALPLALYLPVHVFARYCLPQAPDS